MRWRAQAARMQWKLQLAMLLLNVPLLFSLLLFILLRLGFGHSGYFFFLHACISRGRKFGHRRAWLVGGVMRVRSQSHRAQGECCTT